MSLLLKVYKIIGFINLYFLKFKYRKYLNASTSYNDLKCIEGSNYSLRFSAKQDMKKNDAEKKIIKIVKENKNNPYRLLEYIKQHGTKVYYLRNADKILSLFNLNEGFIPCRNGLKGLFLNLLLNKSFDFNFKSAFVMRKLEIDPYYMIHQFYIWYMFNDGFAGFEQNSQENLNRLINSKNPNLHINKFSISDILEVKEAIRRDSDAIKFVINLAKNSDGVKSAYVKMLTQKEGIKV